jgi:hypothetical protein
MPLQNKILEEIERDLWLKGPRGLTSDWRRWVLALAISLSAACFVYWILPASPLRLLAMAITGYAGGTLTKPLTRWSDAETLKRKAEYAAEIKKINDEYDAAVAGLKFRSLEKE